MNWTGKISSFFVTNGRLSLLLVVAIFAMGAVSFIATPKQYNPQITAPAFQIRVDFPGASRKEVLEQVTKPLENIISDIPNVDDIFSVTERGGGAVVTVNFEVGSDPDSAKITLNDRIQSNFNRAPLGIAEPMIRSIDPDDVPVLTMALRSASVDAVTLRKFAFSLRDRLRTIEGASNIEVMGGRRRELGIIIDPARMKSRGVGISEIEAALQRTNIFLPSGLIKKTDSYVPLETAAVVTRPEDIRSIVVVTGDYGQIRIGDVADIREKAEEIESHVRHVRRGEPSVEGESLVLLSVAKMKGTNISDVTGRIHDELEKLRKGFIPNGITAEVLVDEGRTASNEITGLIVNLFQSIGIVVVVLLLFLDIRAAILVAVSIPLTLAAVFGAGFIAGQNINRITLFALILSLGLLVDSATVVIENIVRRMGLRKKKETRAEVVVAAVNEVGMGLFMSTVTTVLAFIPMAFVTGMMGPYMGPIPFFVPAALIIAFVLSLTVNPWMASVLLKEKKREQWLFFPLAFRRFVDRTTHHFSAITERYHTYLHTLLYNRARRRGFLIAISVLTLAVMALPAVGLVRFRMLPKADREQFFLYADLPAGTPLEETHRVTMALERVLLGQPSVAMVQSYVGEPPVMDFNGLFRGVEARRLSNQATLRVGLTSPDEREKTSEETVLALRGVLNDAAARISPARRVKLKLVEDPPGPPVLSTFLVRVQGDDETLLRAAADDLLARASTVKEIVDTDTSTEDDTRTLQLAVRQDRASVSRIEPARIVQTLRDAWSGKVLGIYHNEGNIEQERIVLRLDRKFRATEAGLKEMLIFNDRGIGIPLGELADISFTDTQKALRRENRRSTVYLFGDMGNRSVTYAAIDFLALLYSWKPTAGYERTSFGLSGATFADGKGGEVRVSLGGEWELTLEVFRDLGLAMGVTIFLIYFVLVAQFASFREPLIIMATIPLSLLGVMPGFLIMGYVNNLYFSATSMIGVIALAGIAVNNSIILLEYLNDMKKTGKKLEDALLEAVRVRLRPIMLTTGTTVLGALTIASDPVWSGLAWAIFFGLGVSSVLTLLVFPTVYYVLKGKEYKA